MKKIHHNKHKIIKLYYQGVSPSVLCAEYNIPSSTLFYWISKYPKSVAMSNDRSRFSNWHTAIAHHKKTAAELAFLQRTILKEFSLRDRMAIIDREFGKESIHIQCEALDVNRSTYLNHRNRGKNDDAWFKKREAEYMELIKKIYEESGHVYGGPKIAAIMRKQGKIVSTDYVKDLMIILGIRSNRSSANKDHKVFARRLREAGHSSQEYHPKDINQVWVSDVSAISVHGRYYYICVYLDLFSRKVVSYNVGRNNSTRLAKRTFIEAYRIRKPKSLTLHTDNGACYTSYGFDRCLRQYGVDHSFSRRQTPHDNAVAESFFNTLKREGIFINDYPRSYKELVKYVKAFIEHYNSARPHEHLNYASPDEFEQNLQEKGTGHDLS